MESTETRKKIGFLFYLDMIIYTAIFSVLAILLELYKVQLLNDTVFKLNLTFLAVL